MGPSVRLSGTFTDPIASPASDDFPQGCGSGSRNRLDQIDANSLEALYIHEERLMWILRRRSSARACCFTEVSLGSHLELLGGVAALTWLAEDSPAVMPEVVG